MSETFSITGVARRRRFPMDQKLAVVAETMQPGMSISYAARRHGLSSAIRALPETVWWELRQWCLKGAWA